MNDGNPASSPAEPQRAARNKGKLTGPKPPLRPDHVWSIRAKLQLERGIRDLALFNLAIDSNLRACDLYPRAIAVLRVAPAQIGAQGPIACRHAWLADGSKAPCSVT